MRPSQNARDSKNGDAFRRELKINSRTGDEALTLLAFRNADTLRDQIAKTKREKGRRLRAKGVRPSKAEAVKSGP